LSCEERTTIQLSLEQGCTLRTPGLEPSSAASTRSGGSLTCDDGREMAQDERLSEITGVDVYFADPQIPWQRGLNENINDAISTS
jgi:IS30 family transposase